MAYKYHTKRRQLTADELDLARKELVEGLMKIDEIEAEKSDALAGFKARMAPHKKEVTKLMRTVRTGIDEGNEYCRVVVDTVTQTVKFFIEKTVWDDETQMNRTEDILFDELTFEEVGEAQISMWQNETEADSADEAIDRLYENDVINVMQDALDEVYADADYHPSADNSLICLLRSWPPVAAGLWMKYVESPSTTTSLAFMHRPIDEALTMFSAGVALLADAGVLSEFDESLFGDLVGDDTRQVASLSLAIANTLPLFEAKADADEDAALEGADVLDTESVNG